MEEQEEQQAVSEKSNPESVDSKLCEECKLKESKYKCPGCSFRSCSLPCVKAHKERTGCMGKRNRTQFVPLSQFDDNQLLSGTSYHSSYYFEFKTLYVLFVINLPKLFFFLDLNWVCSVLLFRL